MTVAETIKYAAEILRENGVADSRRAAKSLMMLALRKDETFLIAHDNYILTATEKDFFDEILQRRAAREPLQYIRGHQEFFGLDFVVSPAVLIPRQETEILVEAAVEILREKKNPRFCEIGAGSGCISVSILHSLKNASAVAADISETALETARKNAVRHSVANRLELKVSDVFDKISDKNFDLIVSNPPYIPFSEIENLQPEVRDFEPQIALTDGRDGLSIIEKIVYYSPVVLKPNGYLLMEIGFDQSEKVSALFDRRIWQSVDFIRDLQGFSRIVKSQIMSKND